MRMYKYPNMPIACISHMLVIVYQLDLNLGILKRKCLWLLHGEQATKEASLSKVGRGLGCNLVKV